ncbi:MAG: DUF4493 domain-containing protein [Muribaculaceae bacterium]|nr:DUF4493 domain-containing protein [Muribaculaceae bacterium]
MKIYKGLTYSLAAIALLTGCANESPFVDVKTAGQTGSLMTRCLAPKLTNTDGVEVGTRADVPSTDDFKVVITRNGGSASTYSSTPGSVEYKYSEMPEVLTLPVGDYKVYAHHGENKPAAWDEPYYYGESTFGIDANKITDDVDPIVAKLANIRVTIVFHPSLISAMSADSKVEVKVGNQGVLTFTPTESRSAYFKYVKNSSTLAATFTGIVDGADVVETKTEDNVAPGNHYRITFRMHGIEDDVPGTVQAAVTVDTTVEKVDMNHTFDGEKEEYFEDDMRPNQGGEDDPTPVEPTAPQITSAKPTEAGLIPVNLEAVNEVTENTYCVLNVVSTAENGIEAFDVIIESEKLNADELSNVGLSDKLDLVNPGSLEEPLTNLGLPVNVGGKKSVSFNITGFMPLLGVLGEGTHNFILTVKDANGETTATLKLHTK